jgi:regulatory protein
MRAFAYRLLGRREYGVVELGRRLHQKWPEATGVADLIEALVEENLVSDERYTETFVRMRIQRHQGPVKIKAALRQKGIDDVLISRELDGYREQWRELAREWLSRQVSAPLDFAGRKKYYRRLTSRGFTHDQAMDTINTHRQQ